MTLPSLLVIVATIGFLILERSFPGRELPKAKGWYWRALFVNFAQLGITLATARLWIRAFDVSVFHLSVWNMPIAEGVVGWFFFYWWHVLSTTCTDTTSRMSRSGIGCSERTGIPRNSLLDVGSHGVLSRARGNADVQGCVSRSRGCATLTNRLEPSGARDLSDPIPISGVVD